MGYGRGWLCCPSVLGARGQRGHRTPREEKNRGDPHGAGAVQPPGAAGGILGGRTAFWGSITLLRGDSG